MLARTALCLLIVLALATISLRANAELITLTQAIELGQKTAPSLRAARANADSEHAQIELARAPYYPRVSAQVQGQANGTRGQQPVQTARGTSLFTYVLYQSAAQGSLTGQWTLYDFGKTGNNVINAEAQYASAAATVSGTALGVVGDVSNAYVTLLFAERLRDVAKTTLTNREKLISVAHALIKAGLQPPLEEMRASARAEAARRDLASAEGSAVDARTVLSILIGTNPTANYQIQAPRLARLEGNLNDVMRDSEHLPAVAAATATFDSKSALADVAEAQYYPTIGLAVTGTYTGSRYDTQDATFVQTNGVGGITVSVPIYDPSIWPAMTAARANAANALGLADQAKRDAREEAARALQGVHAAETMLIHAKKAADDAGGVLTVVQARYVQGLSSPLELIDAESSDADARVAATQSELVLALAIVRLHIATGRKMEAAS